MRQLALFVHWDKNNIIEEYVVTYVRALSEIGIEVAFISNCQISVAELQKVKKFTTDIFTRENLGMDFGAWKYAHRKLGVERIQSYDELIFANDSCLAPMFPFSEMFQRMSSKPCDFWGVTRHSATTIGSRAVPNHLQSYFLVLKNRVVKSRAFIDFMEQIDDQSNSYDDIIYNSEAQFTKTLCDAGFAYAVYLDYADIYPPSEMHILKEPRFLNSTIWCWRRLLNARSPFLKRKAIPYHLARVARLAKIGYGLHMTKEIFRQTFYWKRCLLRSGSSYNMLVLSDLVKRDAPGENITGTVTRGHGLVLFFLYLPYRIFKIWRRAFREWIMKHENR